MFRQIGVFTLFVVALAFGRQAFAQRPNPPLPASTEIRPLKVTPLQKQPGTVTILFLKSWECSGGTTLWDDLKTNWPNFGNIPISIDDTTYICDDFTYQDLVNSAPDVLVLSDPAGGRQQYTATEIQAVKEYASAGHVVVGTYLVFEWSSVDNSELARIFGFQPIGYTSGPITNDFVNREPSSCLMNGISGPSWISEGFAYSQFPSASGRWTQGALEKVKPAPILVAYESDQLALITSRQSGNFASVFISNYPEYYGGRDDEQLLYNSVICFVVQ